MNEPNLFIYLSAVLAAACGILWIVILEEKRVSQTLGKRLKEAWDTHELLLKANTALHEKLIKIRLIMMGDGK